MPDLSHKTARRKGKIQMGNMISRRIRIDKRLWLYASNASRGYDDTSSVSRPTVVHAQKKVFCTPCMVSRLALHRCAATSLRESVIPVHRP